MKEQNRINQDCTLTWEIFFWGYYFRFARCVFRSMWLLSRLVIGQVELDGPFWKKKLSWHDDEETKIVKSSVRPFAASLVARFLTRDPFLIISPMLGPYGPIDLGDHQLQLFIWEVPKFCSDKNISEMGSVGNSEQMLELLSRGHGPIGSAS